MSDSNPTQPPQTNSMVALPSTGATPASLAMTAAVPHRPVAAPASVERGVAKSGFMEKRGSLVKNWKRRFFQLKEKRLEYRRKPEHRIPAGMVELLGSTCSVQGEPGVDLCFLEVVSPNSARRLVIRGAYENMQSWCEAVQAQIDALAHLLPSNHFVNVPTVGDGDFSDGGISPDDDARLVNPGSSLRHSMRRGPSRHPSTSSTASGGADSAIGPAHRFATARLREGWLAKKGVRNQSWRSRWFVLRYGKLEYYKSPTDVAPQGVIILSGGTSALEPTTSDGGGSVFATGDGAAGEQLVTLRVSAPVQCRVYLLRGDRQTMEEWLTAMRQRHSDPRPLLKDDAFSSAAPSDVSLYIPPPSADVSARNSKLGDIMRKVAAGPKLCKMFCKGQRCKYCDYRLWADCGQAINGLYSSWVTDRILATSRPTDAAVKHCGTLDQLVDSGVKTLLNLQQKGEHEFCGPGLTEEGWSYNHDAFVERGIGVVHFGWVDFGVPTMEAALTMTRHFSEALAVGKVAVHCHAGLGRTGMLIACQIVRELLYTGDEAISLVRLRRHGSIQTGEQVQFVRNFADEIARANVMFYGRKAAVAGGSLPTLAHAIEQQAVITSGTLAAACAHTPRVLHLLCSRVEALLPDGVDDLLVFGMRGLRGELVEDALPAFEAGFLFTLQDAVNRGDWAEVDECRSCSLLLHLALGWLRDDICHAAVSADDITCLAACRTPDDHRAVVLAHHAVVDTLLGVVRCLPSDLLQGASGQALMLRFAAALLQLPPPDAAALSDEVLAVRRASVVELLNKDCSSPTATPSTAAPAESAAAAAKFAPAAAADASKSRPLVNENLSSPSADEVVFDRNGSVSFRNPSDAHTDSPLSTEVMMQLPENAAAVLALHMTLRALVPPPAPVRDTRDTQDSVVVEVDVSGIEDTFPPAEEGPEGPVATLLSSSSESEGEVEGAKGAASSRTTSMAAPQDEGFSPAAISREPDRLSPVPIAADMKPRIPTPYSDRPLL